MKPPPAAHVMTRPTWGRPRPQGSSPMGELWGPMVSHTRCPQQGTSPPVCMAAWGRAVTNKALRISALPVLLLFHPKKSLGGVGKSCSRCFHPLGAGTRLSPDLGHHPCFLWEGRWPWALGLSGGRF